MNPFRLISQEEINTLVSRRPGETKIGETILTSGENWSEELKTSPANFVLLGIPEDIGVRANYGVGGTQSLWQPALNAFLNVQETTLLKGSTVLLLGAFDFSELIQRTGGMNPLDMRDLVSEIDDRVYPIIKTIADAGKIPIVIGGGHNNAYPILKGVSRSKGKPIHAINLDAHSDYRSIEGRHSGNGFRYAKMDGYLKRYAVVGLHRNYNAQSVLEEMASDPDIQFCFYEDIFLEEKHDFKQAVDAAIRFTAGKPVGIELDLDCIENVLSSASTPCGIAPLLARRFLTQTARLSDVAYLHLTEGATRLADGREDMLTAKLVSYLITDFIRTCTNKPTVFIRESAI